MRSQIALWMLTKMAMLFFIIALALFATTLGNIQRTTMCSSQAAFTARAVSGVINNVINSPVEDERKILALESSLSIGKDDFQRYAINVRKVTTAPTDVWREQGFFSILVRPFSDETVGKLECEKNECCGGSFVPFENFEINLRGPRITAAPNGELLLFEPSNPREAERSRFLVVIKCKQKAVPSKTFLFIEDCTRETGEACLGFAKPGEPPTEVDQNCGFPT